MISDLEIQNNYSIISIVRSLFFFCLVERVELVEPPLYRCTGKNRFQAPAKSEKKIREEKREPPGRFSRVGAPLTWRILENIFLDVT